MTLKLNFFSGLTTLLTLLCIAWQYTVFENDHRSLLAEVSRLEQIYAVVKDASTLPAKKAELKAFLDVLHEKIPEGDTQDEHLIRSIRTTTLINNSSYHLFEKRQRSQSYYNEKSLVFKVSGPKEDVEIILAEIEETKRLIDWSSLCITRGPVNGDKIDITVSMLVYHFPRLRMSQQARIDPPELDTRTWLPPFTFQLSKTKKRATSIYNLLLATPLAQQHLQDHERFSWSHDRLLQKESILKNLESQRTPLAPDLNTLSTCSDI